MVFDQYQRYKTIQIIIDTIKKQQGLDMVSILELGANEQCNLEKVLPNEKIQYSDLKLTDHMRADGRFVEADATDLWQFEASAYDVVIALDVLEHVPEERRPALLMEANRVAKYVAIVCFPYGTKQNGIAERSANNYYKALFGEDHIWLQEHIQNGLPDLKILENSLQEQNVFYRVFRHGNTGIWEEMMKALFASYTNPRFSQLMESIDDIYAEYIYNHDACEDSYRVFFLMSKEDTVLNWIIEELSFKFDCHAEVQMLEQLRRNIIDIKQLANTKLIAEKHTRKITGKIYFDRGNGYSEADCCIVEADEVAEDKYSLNLTLTELKEIKALRYDPLEGRGCIIVSSIAMQGLNCLDAKYSESVTCSIGQLMLDEDPMISYDSFADDEPIELCVTFLVESATLMMEARKMISVYQQQYLILQKKEHVKSEQVKEYEKQLQKTSEEQEQERVSFRRDMEEREKQLQLLWQEFAELEKKHNDEVERLLSEKEDICANLDQEIKNVADKEFKIHECKSTLQALQEEYEQLQQKYDAVVHSKSWKMTAPLRKIFK